ncbi:hypothetical protein E2C01_044890 [Portunus trituberculatus]|uniref:Uncharacterized protein n=1 Tax=Portunus trituberculatus TaxID=210409 RepID=A0A5B7G1C3_PORTR|nr:hypothetical protein [Portunus trituberculatus]
MLRGRQNLGLQGRTGSLVKPFYATQDRRNKKLAEYKCIYALGIARSMFNIYKCMSNIHPTWVCLAAVFVFALFLYALCLTPSPPPLPPLRSNILYFLEPASHRRSRLWQPSFMRVKVNSHVRTKSRDGSSGGGGGDGGGDDRGKRCPPRPPLPCLRHGSLRRTLASS